MKKIFGLVAVAALFAASFTACKPDEPEVTPVQLDAPVMSVSVSDNVATVKWMAVTNATSYKVEYKESTAADYVVAGTPTYSPFQIPNLEVGKSYDFRMKAVNGQNESDYSSVVTVKIERFLPAPIAQARSGIGFIIVTWEASEGAASYKVEYKLSTAMEYAVAYTGDGTDTDFSVKITGLEGSTAYDIRVAALSEGYSDTYSEVISLATTPNPSSVITNAQQFVAWLSSISEATEDAAALTADIDMTGISITSAAGFSGTLEGQGFSIKNLKSSVPVFATNSGTIKELIIDESCEFTAAGNTFAPLVAQDISGKYISVKNKASVTYKATADVTEPVILGGLVALSTGGTFEKCSNWGAVTFDATGYSHVATSIGGIVGLMNNSASNGSFDTCINYGQLSLQALYGDPNTAFNPDWDSKGINVGGILGCCVYGEGRINFESCENATSGTITFRHAEIDRLEKVENATGPLGIGGIMGLGDRASFNKCRNYALIDAKAKVSDPDIFTENESTENKRRNYLLSIGGISGYGWDATGGHESCINEGNIELDYDGVFSNDDKWRATVGGICGKGDRSSTDSYAYYCKQKGDITVTGRGVVAVGGIFGQNGKQIGNTVEASCHITVGGLKGDVGGLVGYVEGGSANYTIRGCKCYATIFADSIWGEFDKAHYYTIGGLMGRWAGAQTGGNPALADYNGEPCVFSGSVSSVYQNTRVGFILGYSDGDGKTKIYASAEHPILASGTFARKDLEATAITADNIQTYAIGQVKGTTTIYVQFGGETNN